MSRYLLKLGVFVGLAMSGAGAWAIGPVLGWMFPEPYRCPEGYACTVTDLSMVVAAILVMPGIGTGAIMLAGLAGRGPLGTCLRST